MNKNAEELNDDERLIVLQILRLIDHQKSDFSDVEVGQIIYAQSICYKTWLPDIYKDSVENIRPLLEMLCEYDFLEKENNNCYRITSFGLSFLKKNS